ncbi:MAG: biotin synthase BioB [Elusimicrobiota bacterium]
MKLAALTERIIMGYKIEPAEAKSLLKEDLSSLLFGAELIARHYKTDRINFCSIVNAKSGACSENCGFCAQSAHHKTKVEKYALLDDKRLSAALSKSVKDGASCFGIVTSGRKLTDKDIDRICSFVSKNKNRKIRISASLGDIGKDGLRKLKKAGVSRYHHNLETSESFFPRICTTHTFADRIRTAGNVKKAGLELCCGGIIGLGEKPGQRIELAFALRKLGADSVPINILNPVRGTPMGKRERMAPEDILRTIAVFRFILPDKDISVCGGREINLGKYQPWIFSAGANGMMVGGYLTTPGRPAWQDRKMVEILGYRISGKKEE